MAVARNKAVSSLVGEIGDTKAELENKEAAGSFAGEMGVTKAELGNKVAAGSFTGKIDPAGSFTDKIGVTEDELGNKEADGSFTGEIGVTKAELEAAGTAMVTAASWIDYVICSKKLQPLLAPKEEGKVDPMVSLITKERVPDTFIDILKKRRLVQKLPPVSECRFAHLFPRFPKLRDLCLIECTERNCWVDLHVDVLRQHAEKGFAEVGVVYTDGVKKIFVLPQPQPQPQDDAEGVGGGVRSKTKLVFVSGFAILFALLVVLLSLV